jgi:hypothetical protein
VCEKDIKVGMGGLPNFLKQHNPGKSKACQLVLEKKNKLNAVKRSQPCLQSFFTRCPKAFVPPIAPIPHCVITHVIKPTSSVANVSTLSSPIPNILVNKLLADLENAISTLPSTLSRSDPTEIEELTIFPPILPTNMDHNDIWEFILDPHLNCFLGFGKSVESIATLLKRQKMALVSMVNFLRDITGQFQIDGALLEGKVQ